MILNVCIVESWSLPSRQRVCLFFLFVFWVFFVLFLVFIDCVPWPLFIVCVHNIVLTGSTFQWNHHRTETFANWRLILVYQHPLLRTLAHLCIPMFGVLHVAMHSVFHGEVNGIPVVHCNMDFVSCQSCLAKNY